VSRAETSSLGDLDLLLFAEGTHRRIHEKLGAHQVATGTSFAVWAPNARAVSVIGDFNGWDPTADPLVSRGSSGIWEGVVASAEVGHVYKFHVESNLNGSRVDKADPYALRTEEPPRTGSIVWDLGFDWNDDAWMASRGTAQAHDRPISIYEVHLGSWMRDEGGRPLSYTEIAAPLAEHVKELGFTHVELLPVMEHPFYGSWGYQTTGYFAPTARYGSPQDLMALVDHLHREGIGLILDWVPSHFPTDEHGLALFDGTHLYEHADPRRGFHPDWKTLIFNYGRNEVRSFLLSSAHHWLSTYHADGLRVDAVASMLYLDYSRKEGEWLPNRFGGRENLEAIEFLRRLNADSYADVPGIQTYAEESTAWPMVSRPTDVGGLGFGYKWDMGWMHDTLEYFSHDPVHRAYHHDAITFRQVYAGSENFVLPLSHDEVVHGKGSLLGKMPGDRWQKFANLRLLLGYQWAQTGKKLLFQGCELAQPTEWNHEAAIDFGLADDPAHGGVRRWVSDLNRVYRQTPALHELDTEPGGFEWIDGGDRQGSTMSFLRRGRGDRDVAVVVCNFTPVPRDGFRLGVPFGAAWREILNGDAVEYGGSGAGNLGQVVAEDVPANGRPCSLAITLPPLACLVLVPAERA
jgi:1,4-alpha-glucan branching enzyme